MIEATAALGALPIRGPDTNISAPSVGGLGGVAGSPSQGPDFASVLAEVAASGMQTLKAGEVAALGGLQGKMSVQQVVEAVMSAEQTLQAAIAVRDKVVAAYQEISRMAI